MSETINLINGINRMIFTGVIVDDPILHYTKENKPYVQFIFKINEAQIPMIRRLRKKSEAYRYIKGDNLYIEAELKNHTDTEKRVIYAEAKRIHRLKVV